MKNKITITVLLIAILISGCADVSEVRYPLIVKKVELRAKYFLNETPIKQYRVELSTIDTFSCVYYFTDSLYQVGDTIR